MPSKTEMRTWWRAGTGYEPTELQWPIHTTPHRFILVAGGERSGKSKTAGMFVIPRTPECKLVWIIAADYDLCVPEFNYIRDEYRAIGMIARISDPTGKYMPRSLITKTGLHLQTLSAADFRKIAARAPDIILLAEAAQLSVEIWERSRGRVAENRGIVLLEGTFEEAEPWYDDYWANWKGGTEDGHISFSLPSWSNTVIYPGGLDDPEMRSLQKQFSAERFQARHAGVPTPPRDLVHPEFNYTIHAVDYANYDPRFRVWLAVDPGYAGAYAVNAIQVIGTGRQAKVRVIDEVYVQYWQAREVILEVLQRPWMENVVMDAAGVMDIAGGQHHGNESQLEIWAEFGFRFSTVAVSIPDGIERMRTFLKDPESGEPRIVYNNLTATDSMLEFRKYKYRKGTDGKPVRENPIDAHNHSIKAITYFLVKMFGVASRTNQRRRKQRYNFGRRTEQGVQGASDGPFGAYPGTTGRGRIGQPSYAERWMDRHDRWKAAASNGKPIKKPTSTAAFRFRRKR